MTGAVTIRRGMAGVVMLALAVGGCSSVSDQRVTVNGHELALSCGGTDGPTVVFEAAIGGDHSLWPIADRLRDRAFVCTYDRAGNGNSPPPTGAMTATGHVADLHALLAAASVPRPVVIVGHSYGGLIAWMLAIEHPEDVAGVVLIDGSLPAGNSALELILTPDQVATFEAGFDDFPYIDFTRSLDEAGPDFLQLTDVPVTVITATHSMAPWCDQGLPCGPMQTIWVGLEKAFVVAHPGVRQVEAATSHYVQDDDPDLVVTEISAVLDKIQ